MYKISVLKLVKSEPLARFALAIPALGTLIGSLLMAFGGLLPCLVMDAVGLVLGLLILLSLLLKYLWIEHLLMAGEIIEGKILKQTENQGLPITQTTELEYLYVYEGVKYRKRITVHLPENLESTTVLLDPDKPESSIIRELYCVPGS
ncbi:MAG: hypothetical protein K2X27_07520 [Candidatus Obscuribacterales bacterium]|nr:hypothetical protein [Candidatus Obscuribacterales bacterium]